MIVEPSYKTGFNSQCYEAINFISDNHGNLHTVIEATKNAVIVQVFEDVDEDGEKTVRRFISIECIDPDMLPALKAEAQRLIRL